MCRFSAERRVYALGHCGHCSLPSSRCSALRASVAAELLRCCNNNEDDDADVDCTTTDNFFFVAVAASNNDDDDVVVVAVVIILLFLFFLRERNLTRLCNVAADLNMLPNGCDFAGDSGCDSSIRCATLDSKSKGS